MIAIDKTKKRGTNSHLAYIIIPELFKIFAIGEYKVDMISAPLEWGTQLHCRLAIEHKTPHLRRRPVVVAEVFVWINGVTNPLFQLLGLWEAFVNASVPAHVAVD